MKLIDKINLLEEQGVVFLDKDKVEIRGDLICGKDVEIDTNVIFEGNVVIEDKVKIKSNVLISSSYIGSGTIIKPFSIIENTKISKYCMIGPQARLRPDTFIGDNCQIGNFVEIKNSKIGNFCRINHMAFIGDARLEDEVTIGAGTITCNHDGLQINETIIEKGAYIGSNVNLVAPLRISSNSTIGSGSTITKDVPQDKLTLARSKQVTIRNWKGPKSKRD